MKKYKKKDDNGVLMIKVDDPITLDKSAEWGEGNVQSHDEGCWIQLSNETIEGTEVFGVSHLVANVSLSGVDIPVGWKHAKNPFNEERTETQIFNKLPVFAEQETVANIVRLETLDGKMEYDNAGKDGWILYNGLDGKPDQKDPWFMKDEQFKNTYEED